MMANTLLTFLYTTCSFIFIFNPMITGNLKSLYYNGSGASVGVSIICIWNGKPQFNPGSEK
jgi:hypothetical protein